MKYHTEWKNVALPSLIVEECSQGNYSLRVSESLNEDGNSEFQWSVIGPIGEAFGRVTCERRTLKQAHMTARDRAQMMANIMAGEVD